jgi:hypothetical protein
MSHPPVSIYPYESFLEFGKFRVVAERLRSLIDSHIAHCYEKLCREFVSFQAVELDCLRVGRQWGKNNEIEVAGVNGKNELVVVGECKWSRRKVGLSVLRDLKQKITVNKLLLSDDCRYLLFGKSGFTKELQEMANRDHRLRLVDSIF